MPLFLVHSFVYSALRCVHCLFNAQSTLNFTHSFLDVHIICLGALTLYMTTVVLGLFVPIIYVPLYVLFTWISDQTFVCMHDISSLYFGAKKWSFRLS